jgi:hypothetical protein
MAFRDGVSKAMSEGFPKAWFSVQFSPSLRQVMLDGLDALDHHVERIR